MNIRREVITMIVNENPANYQNHVKLEFKVHSNVSNIPALLSKISEAMRVELEKEFGDSVLVVDVTVTDLGEEV
jgi:hypothetical protein